MVIRDAYDKGLAGRSSGLHGGVNPPKPPMPPGFDRTQGPGGPNSLPAWATNPGVRDAAAAASPQGPGAPPPPGAGGMPAGRSFFDLIADMAGGGGGGAYSVGDPTQSPIWADLLGMIRGDGATGQVQGFLDAGRTAANRTAGANASTAMQRALASGAPASGAAGLANQAVGDTMANYDQLAAQTILSSTQQDADRRMRGIEVGLDMPLRADQLRISGANSLAGNRLGAARLGLEEAGMGFDQAMRAADFQRLLDRDLLGYGDIMTGAEQGGIDAQQAEQQRQWGVFLDILNQIPGLGSSAPMSVGGGGNQGLAAGQTMMGLGGLASIFGRGGGGAGGGGGGAGMSPWFAW